MIFKIINPPCLDKRSNYTSATTIPLGISYPAAYLRKNNIDVEIIDALGEGIGNVVKYDKNYVLVGLGLDEIISRIGSGTDAIGVSVNFSVQQQLLLELIRRIRAAFPDKPVIIGGNEATINHRLYLDNGANYAVLGEGEETTLKLLRSLGNRKKIKSINGLAYYEKKKLVVKNKTYIKDIDKLPYPARDMLPLQNYWKAKKSHGPVTSKFTSIITSRGCPFNCSFCSSTIFWGGVWRKRSVESVIDEIKKCKEKFGIGEFEFEDDNMTLDVNRAKLLFARIIEEDLNIRWSTPNGIRSDFVDEEMLVLMKKSGCSHLTFAPESGSTRILRDVYNKTIDLEKIKKLVGKSNELDIKTACFFVVGTPAENEYDRLQTKRYIAELARLGLDEIGVFPCVPYPGTRIREMYDIRGLKEELIIGDIPQWYPNYGSVTKHIRSLYILFLMNKLIHHPEKIIRSLKNIIAGKQELKMERTIISLVSKFRF